MPTKQTDHCGRSRLGQIAVSVSNIVFAPIWLALWAQTRSTSSNDWPEGDDNKLLWNPGLNEAPRIVDPQVFRDHAKALYDEELNAGRISPLAMDDQTYGHDVSYDGVNELVMSDEASQNREQFFHIHDDEIERRPVDDLGFDL